MNPIYALLVAVAACPGPQTDPVKDVLPSSFSRDKLVAWCIVPFDGKNRGPAERAEMLRRLGMKRVAYDWRQKHVSEFEEEILQYKKHGLEYFAFWGTHPRAFELFKKYDLHPQIWMMIQVPKGKTQQDKIRNASTALLPLVRQTQQAGCKLGLYNHGGWSGEPQNLVAVCEFLRKHHNANHVGIVYNLHHAHDHISDFADVLHLMRPYLHCLNLNGMATNGDQVGKKILPLGTGEHDVRLMKVIARSGYTGPIGIIGHTQDDVELRLADNLDGLDWIRPQLAGNPAGKKPQLRTYSIDKKRELPTAGILLPGKQAYRQSPITVECRATVSDRSGYNIFVASDSKASGQHWEMFSMRSTGMLTAYTPGLKPDHLHSEAMVCDGKPHTLALQLDATSIRLIVDGKNVAEQKVATANKPNIPGALGIGRLVNGKLACSGKIEWVRLTRGIRNDFAGASAEKEGNTLLLWQSSSKIKPANSVSKKDSAVEYSAELVAAYKDSAIKNGSAARGLVQFASAKLACVSCHKVGKHGGNVGPALTEIAKQRTSEEIIEAVVWPARQVKPEFQARLIVTDDGKTRQGYVIRRDAHSIVLQDPVKANAKPVTIKLDAIEDEKRIGTLMPQNLLASISSTARDDLFQFLLSLGKHDANAKGGSTATSISVADIDSLLEHAVGHSHGPTVVKMDKAPLKAELHPHADKHVNRDRIYDFYAKQANYFRQTVSGDVCIQRPMMFSEFPGLDGGKQGHWGNQNESVWVNNDWNSTELGSLQSGVTRGPGFTVARGICSRLKDSDLSVCFDPMKLDYAALWKGGFVKFSDVRHGFVGGLKIDGKMLPRPRQIHRNATSRKYLGLYRNGSVISHAYQIGEQTFLDTPVFKNGEFQREIRKFDPAARPLQSTAQWPDVIQTRIVHGTNRPYAIDTIQLPTENPWKALLYISGVALAPDGSAMVTTMQGDVWRVTNVAYPSRSATWKRFAAGLHQPLGIRVDPDGIFVLCRDQVVRLHDTNKNGEADFYECFANGFVTSRGGHDYICGLERDADGNFYTASGNQGILKISADGQTTKVLATGFRNPDGIGLLPDGTVTVPCSEGTWTPATMICAVRPSASPSYHGFGGPKNNQPPELPLVYIPRAIDNSAGGQTVVNSDQWGPLRGQLIHTSFGTGSYHLVLRDEVDGQLQGALVPMPGEFLSGAHRAAFSPADGQLYVGGMQGWGSYTPQTGCFQRVRYTTGSKKAAVSIPTGWRAYENGVSVTFSESVDATFAADVKHQFVQCWNYRYSKAYGSPEFSPSNPATKAHDILNIASVHVVDDKTLFLEIPDLQPVNQLHLRLWTNANTDHELFATVHKLHPAFQNFNGYQPREKTIRRHPIYTDLALASRNIFNPFAKTKRGARAIRIKTSGNLSFDTRQFKVKAGELLALTLDNADVVPHNWALVKPGALQRIGQMANKLIADPDAVFRQYVPDSDDVLAYTDIVSPREEFTIYFRAPGKPGTYPYLCTFPGHWLVMNGEMIVE